MEINKKHTDVVNSIEEFNSRFEAGVYAKPWIVYVDNGSGGYSVIYSNDEGRTSLTPEFESLITKRVENLENEKVFCKESEYETLIQNGEGWVTDVVLDENGEYKKYWVTLQENDTRMFYVYED